MKDIHKMDWNSMYDELNKKGYTIIPSVLLREECQYLASLYSDHNLYRSVVNMERYRFGKGEYKYFNYPLPLTISSLREILYQHLVPVANEWMNALSLNSLFPPNHKDLIEKCHNKDQERPTPLILRYEKGGYNTLHQDLYGEIFFPLQAVFMLSEPAKDFEGGEFIMLEQLPRAQSKAQVIHLNQGDALIFTNNFRPVKGSRGYYRVRMKHGVSEVTSGVRYTMGIIFHDAA